MRHAKLTGRSPLEVLRLPAGEYAIESALVMAALEERGEQVRKALSGVKDAEVAQTVLLGMLAADG